MWPGGNSRSASCTQRSTGRHDDKVPQHDRAMCDEHVSETSMHKTGCVQWSPFTPQMPL